MVAKQLSIFLENKSGRLTEVTEVLAKENINLSALCIAENADFGILRGIVSDPDRAYKALKDNHFAVNITELSNMLLMRFVLLYLELVVDCYNLLFLCYNSFGKGGIYGED